MKLPTFSICLLNLDPTPENFIIDITKNILRNKKFALSAWPGLSHEQRIEMAVNIEQTGSFSKMLKGITIDSSLRNFFEDQQYGLQKILEYMAPEKQLEHPDFNLIRRVSGYKKSPWDRLTRDFRSKKFKKELFGKQSESVARVYLEHLSNLVKEMPVNAKADVVQEFGGGLSESDLSAKINQWLNQRTNLYRAISDYPESVRQLLREHINDAYDDSLTESVTDTGRQVSADNGNKGVSYKTRSKHMDLMKGESAEDFVAIPYDSGIDNDTMANLVEVLSDDLIQKSIATMRNIRERTDTSIDQIDEAEDKHLKLLTRYIPSLIVERGIKSQVVDFVFNKSGRAIKVIGWTGISGVEAVLGTYLASANQLPQLLLLLAAAETSKLVVPNLVDSAGEKMKPLKNRLKVWLNSKDSKIIAGRVSEWLENE
jgi:hypothetical protein